MGPAASRASLVQVSRLVGHRSTRTTQDVYGYLIDEGSSKVLDVVASALEIDRGNVKVSDRCQGGAGASP
jgi:integrase